MKRLFARDIELIIDTDGGFVSSLKIGGVERCVGSCPLFVARLRDAQGECLYINSKNSRCLGVDGDIIAYTGFGGALDELCVKVLVSADASISWRVEIDSVPSEYALEWIELAKVCLPRLIENDSCGGRLLFPYNEGILLSDESALPRYEPEFPSSGAYFIFPNMVCSQFMAYLFEDVGLYIGAHDPKRALKGVDFYPSEGGLCLQMRLYSGADYGQSFKTDYEIVWSACGAEWKSPCEIYRRWFENNLPPRVTPIRESSVLPEWYESSPLVVTYPVRGMHDTDTMEPNALFPYTNALPILSKLKRDTGCQIMALLMHWEGTAPWAPPYVWPPFGGESAFNEFRDALHKNGDLIGVYCSGFGYTLRSTLIESYHCEEKIKSENALEGVCHSPKNKPELGITCTPYQRYGYDICPVSSKGRAILDKAYSPLFNAGIDYAQILDQNHGGGQYMCYARGHLHPPMPGEWMTSSMQSLLSCWSDSAPNTIFGCESAGAEPFIGNLLMSDNRFELNYPFGEVVPVYAYIYHEYVRNFMGNQCGCPFDTRLDTLRYRLAYSFSIGDIMTLVIAPNGELMTHWSTRDFDNPPSMERTTLFIKNVMKFYNEKAREYLYSGKMSSVSDIVCESISIPMLRGRPSATLPRLLFSTWEAEGGKTAYIVVNPEETPISFFIGDEKFEAPPLDAILIVK